MIKKIYQMAFHRSNKKIPLPDTQDVFSDEFSQQQTFCTAEDSPPVWAKMSYLPIKNHSHEIRNNEAVFGRDSVEKDKVDEFVFNSTNLPKYYERVSKCHFTITRDDIPLDENKENPNMNPAVIVCHGRNGIFINKDKLELGDRQILAHNDTIKLTKGCELFKFEYSTVPPEMAKLPKACLEKYYIGKPIGSGGHGTVNLIHSIKTMRKYAMKIIRKETNPMVRDRKASNAKILNEVNIMKTLHHEHVLSLVDFYETQSCVVIIMDYLEGRDMLHRITKYYPKLHKLPEMEAKFFFLQACRGLKYLHDSHVTHRDIKPDNILLSSDSPDAILKITDFGLSKVIAADSMKTVCGTHLYVAPEVLLSTTYTNKVDIWSMGCLLFAMLSGAVPFNDTYGPPDMNTQIKEALLVFRQNAWKEVSGSAKDLIRRMLQKEPKMRPSINEVMAHPWLRCHETIKRVNRLYKLDDTMVISDDEDGLELTLVGVRINDESDNNKSIVQPPAKRRKLA